MRQSQLVKIGGSLGIAACFVSIAVFLLLCFGFQAADMLALVPVTLAAIGMVVSVIGGVARTHAGDEETQPISALFVCLFGLIGGLIETYLWFQMSPKHMIGM